VKPAGGTPIPRDGAVLVGKGTSSGRLASEAPIGQTVTARLILQPQWGGVVDAVGGGPVIVRDGQPVFRALESFTSNQLSLRNPRTAVGQREDGTIVLVAVDGRQPGYSTGLTNFELALAMMRLGCVTASALDAGGSTTMAFDGKLLNRPSDGGGERSIKETLAVMYTGVYAPPPLLPVISPAGGGLASQETLAYKVVRASTVTASIIGPDGSAGYTETSAKLPGTYQVTWPSGTAAARRRALTPLGRWRWVVHATDDLSRESAIERTFWVNDTLGFLRVSPRAVRLRPRGRNLVLARFRLAHSATVVGMVRTRTGALVRKLGPVKLGAGTRAIRWNGRYRSGRLAYRGSYMFSVYAKNAYGPVTLAKTFGVRR
jgi:hypothetical protein